MRVECRLRGDGVPAGVHLLLGDELLHQPDGLHDALPILIGAAGYPPSGARGAAGWLDYLSRAFVAVRYAGAAKFTVASFVAQVPAR